MAFFFGTKKMFSARVCGGPRCPLGPGTDVPAQALKLKRWLPAQVTPCICIIPLSKIDIDSITDDPHDESVQRWIPLHLKYRPSHSMWPMKLIFFLGRRIRTKGYHIIRSCVVFSGTQRQSFKSCAQRAIVERDSEQNPCTRTGHGGNHLV